MAIIKLNCRGTIIEIDTMIINLGEVINAYASGRFKKDESFYINCTAETMHKILDELPSFDFNDKNVMRVVEYLQIEQDENKLFIDMFTNINEQLSQLTTLWQKGLHSKVWMIHGSNHPDLNGYLQMCECIDRIKELTLHKKYEQSLKPPN
jgi:hypothetical protein